jgi:hypothetical protein
VVFAQTENSVNVYLDFRRPAGKRKAARPAAPRILSSGADKFPALEFPRKGRGLSVTGKAAI